VTGGIRDPSAAETQDVDSLLSVLYTDDGIVARPRQAKARPVGCQPLSQRERQVLSLAAEGHSNKRIAARLEISERTVKTHLRYIMTRLRASDRTHAVVTAVRLGWLAI